jgi:hypothetical protein
MSAKREREELDDDDGFAVLYHTPITPEDVLTGSDMEGEVLGDEQKKPRRHSPLLDDDEGGSGDGNDHFYTPLAALSGPEEEDERVAEDTAEGKLARQSEEPVVSVAKTGIHGPRIPYGRFSMNRPGRRQWFMSEADKADHDRLVEKYNRSYIAWAKEAVKCLGESENVVVS